MDEVISATPMNAMLSPPVRVPAAPSTRVREALKSEPLSLILREALQDLRRSESAIRALAWRDVSAELRGSSLWWLGGVVSVITLTMFATAMRNAGVLTVSHASLPYPVFVLLGAVAWTGFLDSLQSPVRALRAEAAFLVGTTSAAETVLVAGLAPVLLRLAAKGIVLVLVMAWFQVVPAPTVIFAWLPLALAVAVGFALGLFLAPLSLLFRGLPTLIDSLSVVLFLLTPVCFLPPDGMIGRLMSLNPLSPLITGFRELITSGLPTHGAALAAAAVATVGLLFAGIVFSRVALPVVLEHARG